MTLDDIDPGRMYPLATFCALVPSCRAGKRLSIKTVHRWRKAGRVVCVSRLIHRKRHWFVSGAELLRHARIDTVPVKGRTPKQRERDHEVAMAELRKMGLRV